MVTGKLIVSCLADRKHDWESYTADVRSNEREDQLRLGKAREAKYFAHKKRGGTPSFAHIVMPLFKTKSLGVVIALASVLSH